MTALVRRKLFCSVTLYLVTSLSYRALIYIYKNRKLNPKIWLGPVPMSQSMCPVMTSKLNKRMHLKITIDFSRCRWNRFVNGKSWTWQLLNDENFSAVWPFMLWPSLVWFGLCMYSLTGKVLSKYVPYLKALLFEFSEGHGFPFL